jgi:hypothetical protein
MQDLYGEQDGLNVFTAVNKMRLKVDSDKTDKTVTNTHIKNVEYNEGTGTFKFIRENGEEITVDTALEKISINFAYSPETESLIITLLDGTTQTVPLSSLISENEWNESATVKFNVSGHKVSAVVKYNSITDEHLSSTLRETLISYVTEAQNSATDAEQSKMLAETYAENASASALDASNAASLAEDERLAASDSASSALRSKQAAEKAQQDAEKAAEESKKARDEAVEISGFDPSLYVKNDDIIAEVGDIGLVKYGGSAKGFVIDKDDYLCIQKANDDRVKAKQDSYRPLTPSSIDLAVKVGLTTNASTLTDEEKNTIANWLGGCRIATGDYEGAGGIEGIVQIALGFSPDIVLLICPETEGSNFASFAIFFRYLSKNGNVHRIGTYWDFANDTISKKQASNLEFASDTFIAELGDNTNYSMQLKTYYYIAIGREE